MKKSLLALAALGAFASVASAQSSVTLFGIMDLALRNNSATGKGSTQTMAQDGYNSSRLGVRGVEDIGGGLKAGFHMEGAVNPDTGTPGGQTWRRRSTISLMGGFGEVRLGRDYTPSFWNYTVFDAFGTNGVGNALNVSRNSGSQATFVRADNSVGYFLPSNLGGLYGQVMIAAPEGVNSGKYFGGRIGYGAGPFNAALAIGQQNAVAPKYKTTNLGLSYDFGFAKGIFMWAQEKNGAVAKETQMNLGLTAPLGAGELRASFNRMDVANSANDASQIAVGYVHNLSKRTALYGTFSRLSNKGTGTLTNNTLAPTAGGKATGMEVGVRHAF